MSTSPNTKSERAIDLALSSIGGGQGTALVVLLFAVTRKLGETFDAETAAELTYKAADDLVARSAR